MNIYKIFLLGIILSLSACLTNSSDSSSLEFSKENTSFLHLLFFKKEKRLEVWATNNDAIHSQIQSFENIECGNTPIGIFLLNLQNSPLLVLETPNEFYGQKLGQEQFEDIFILNKKSFNTNRQSIVMNISDLEKLLRSMSEDIPTKVFIFPNDIRNSGVFEPCFGCPHRVAELYSSLELHLKQFDN